MACATTMAEWQSELRWSACAKEPKSQNANTKARRRARRAVERAPSKGHQSQPAQHPLFSWLARAGKPEKQAHAARVAPPARPRARERPLHPSPPSLHLCGPYRALHVGENERVRLV
eukprot:5056744-Pleurochrysis_carterae.AAC.2